MSLFQLLDPRLTSNTGTRTWATGLWSTLELSKIRASGSVGCPAKARDTNPLPHVQCLSRAEKTAKVRGTPWCVIRPGAQLRKASQDRREDLLFVEEKAPHLPKEGRYGPRDMWATGQQSEILIPEPPASRSTAVYLSPAL